VDDVRLRRKREILVAMVAVEDQTGG